MSNFKILSIRCIKLTQKTPVAKNFSFLAFKTTSVASGQISPKSAKFRPKIFGAKFNYADSPISNKFRPKKI
jgi:hypothetical protein